MIEDDDPFPSDRLISHIDIPTVFVHGLSDNVIPISQGRELYKVAKCRDGFYEVNATHNDLLPRIEFEFVKMIFR